MNIYLHVNEKNNDRREKIYYYTLIYNNKLGSIKVSL